MAADHRGVEAGKWPERERGLDGAGAGLPGQPGAPQHDEARNAGERGAPACRRGCEVDAEIDRVVARAQIASLQRVGEAHATRAGSRKRASAERSAVDGDRDAAPGRCLEAEEKLEPSRLIGQFGFAHPEREPKRSAPCAGDLAGRQACAAGEFRRGLPGDRFGHARGCTRERCGPTRRDAPGRLHEPLSASRDSQHRPSVRPAAHRDRRVAPVSDPDGRAGGPRATLRRHADWRAGKPGLRRDGSRDEPRGLHVLGRRPRRKPDAQGWHDVAHPLDEYPRDARQCRPSRASGAADDEQRSGIQPDIGTGGIGRRAGIVGGGQDAADVHHHPMARHGVNRRVDDQPSAARPYAGGGPRDSVHVDAKEGAACEQRRCAPLQLRSESGTLPAVRHGDHDAGARGPAGQEEIRGARTGQRQDPHVASLDARRAVGGSGDRQGARDGRPEEPQANGRTHAEWRDVGLRTGCQRVVTRQVRSPSSSRIMATMATVFLSIT